MQQDFWPALISLLVILVPLVLLALVEMFVRTRGEARTADAGSDRPAAPNQTARHNDQARVSGPAAAPTVPEGFDGGIWGAARQARSRASRAAVARVDRRRARDGIVLSVVLGPCRALAGDDGDPDFRRA